MTSSRPTQAEDVTSIVIENGSSWTRVGYASESSPRHIIPTQYAKNTATTSKSSYSFGYDAVNNPEPGKEIFNPLVDGIIQDWDAMAAQWQYIYSDLLDIDASEQPLAITEQSWNPVSNKQKAAEVAFEQLGVPIFSIVPSALSAAYHSSRPTALVVDVGSGVTSVTPVVEGSVIYKAACHSKFAGDFVNLHLYSHLKSQRGVDIIPEFLVKKRNLVEPGQPAQATLYDFKGVTDSFMAYHTASVLTGFKETISQVSDVPFTSSSALARVGRSFEFPDGFNLTFGPERLTTTEALFTPALYDLPNITLPESASEQGITNLIYQAISRCDSVSTNAATTQDSSARVLLNNIILTGGTSLIQGLATRIEFDLQHLFPGLVPRISYSAQNAAEIKNINWTGTSILSSLGTFDSNFWVTKQEYEEYGRELIEKKFKH